MTYASLNDAVLDLDRQGLLLRIKEEVDPNLEMAAVQRQAYAKKAKAILFEKVKGSPFRALCNLYGTEECCHALFRKTLEPVKKVVQLKADPTQALKYPWRYWRAPFTALTALPKRVKTGPVLHNQTTIDQLPQIKSWPDDGGAFITLPQVFTKDPDDPKNLMGSNLGMYRIQLSGNNYITNEEIGLHYQIHRGIGDHHAKALKRGEPLKVSIFVGGPPAHTFGAVMPMPEGLSELTFAGMLAGRRFRMSDYHGFDVSVDADFCIIGEIDPTATKPEGPFGDHLGYYSLTHDFPVMRVKKVFHRDDAIWPFTVVGRPPQEDSSFGHLIHTITRPMVPAEIPGVKEIHAVDEAGVHPLLLAIGKERYVPYSERKPQELLTCANAILGFNQASLAKYLLIAAEEDAPNLSTGDSRGFIAHILERIDWRRDLHFQTETTMDTLDYSGTGLNSGSKVIMAAAGKKKRNLAEALPEELKLPTGFTNPRMVSPGIIAIQCGAFVDHETTATQLSAMDQVRLDSSYPLIVLVDDSQFVSEDFANFLWVTFTRSNPSHDIYGIHSSIQYKHWGCTGALIIDARIKPHHAPPLVEDSEAEKRAKALLESGRA